MKVKIINDKFRKFAKFQLKNKWLFLSFAIIVAFIGFMGLRYLKPHNARESWFEEHEKIEINTKKFEAQFGNNDNIIVLIEADDVFDPEVLNMMKELGNELLDSIPYSDEITSLVDMEISVGTDYGIEVINPFEDGIPEDPNELEEIRQLVLSRRSLKNKIVSADCKETILMLSLKEFPPEKIWSKETTVDPLFQVGEPAIRIITSERYQSNKYTLKAAGLPYTETEERDFFTHETAVRLMTVFIAMIVLLIILIRNFKGIVTPLIIIGIAGATVFGYMGWLRIGIDTNMVMLPALLGMALAVAYSIHLFNAFKRFFNKTGKRKESIISAVEETGWPLLFTAITTIGSVASFATVGIPTITWVGFTCAAVVLSSFFFVIIIYPILLSFGKDKMIIDTSNSHNAFIENILIKLGHFTVRYKKAIFITFIVISVLLVPAIFLVKVDMDIFKAMGLKIPYINRVHDVSESQLGSYLSYNISVDFNEQDAIKSPEVLKNFDKILDSVSSYTLTKKIDDNVAIFSILDIIKEMNQTLHSDSIEYYKIPDTREEIAQILLLYEMSGGTKTFNWIDEDYSIMRAQVQITKFKKIEIAEDLNNINRLSGLYLPDATVTVIGSAVQFAEIAHKIVVGELKSVFLSLIIISILLMLVFSSIKTGFIGLIPNLMPMLAIAAYLGYFNEPLNMMAMTIIPMMLGIAVDDTIHFINSIKYEFEKCGNYRSSVISAFGTVGKSLAMTTIVLVISFAMYLFSPVNMIGTIGLLATIGLIVALLTDYLVTPVLVLLTKPFGQENNK